MREREERPDLELELGLGPIDLSFLDVSPFDLSFLDLKLDELPDFGWLGDFQLSGFDLGLLDLSIFDLGDLP